MKSMPALLFSILLLLLLLGYLTNAFQVPLLVASHQQQKRSSLLLKVAQSSSSSSSNNQQGEDYDKDENENDVNNKDNKAMAFLRKIGRVGGPHQDFRHVIGVDEGSVGKSSGGGAGGGVTMKKTLASFSACTETGIIDDLSETFPITSCGTTWSGYTDQVMGGISSAILTREESFHGRVANVLRGRVSLENNGGFVQMATNLAKDPLKSPTVDASKFDGVELDVLYEGQDEKEKFNIHLKTDACIKPFSSYRAAFEVRHGKWTTIRLPWSDFNGKGPGASEIPFNRSALTRAGIVAIGKPMERLVLAISGFRFYKEARQLPA